MSNETLSGLHGAAERRAAARSVGYRLFAEALDYPDELLLEEIREGRLARALEELLEGLAPELPGAVDWDALRDAGDEDELQIEYTRLFDVGASGPPCPLYGGLYGGARMKTMEEAVRFYNHFGLTLSETLRELPDHLRTQLEFLHYLAFREAEALQRGADAGPYRRAQRDFLERHPGRWVPKLRGRLESQKPMRFFSELVTGLERFLDGARAELMELTREAEGRNGQADMS
jgi:DMSO reductase family type II enzyme chaperone